MAELPSFFNKPDFLGALLPGYIAVILTLVLFFPELVPVQNSNGLALDFFSAVVFIVTGPAVGYTLRQIHRIFYTLISTPNREKRKNAIKQYYSLRITLNDSEKTELDMSEAAYDFNISTALIFLTYGLYFSVKSGFSLEWNSIPLIGASIIFFIGGYLERAEGFIPLYTKLVLKYRVS